MQKTGIIIFIIALVIVFAYAIFEYNPSGLKFKNIASLFRAPTSTYYYGPGGAEFSPYKPPAPASGSYIAPPQQQQPQINPSDIPRGFTLQDLSPYFKKISLSASASYFGSYGQIYLSGYLNQGERVNVTGWLIRGNRGSMYIPQAVAVYDPQGFAAESDINLGSGDALYIYSSYSPISRNLRLNKCTGYLSNINTFTPSLPLNCPYINRSEISNFTSPCQTYILSLGSCKMPVPNPPVPENDISCRQFLSKLNYAGCFEKYRNDADFLSREWRAWAGTSFWDSQHDRLLLFDREGLLVNEYSY